MVDGDDEGVDGDDEVVDGDDEEVDGVDVVVGDDNVAVKEEGVAHRSQPETTPNKDQHHRPQHHHQTKLHLQEKVDQTLSKLILRDQCCFHRHHEALQALQYKFLQHPRIRCK